MKIRKCDHCGEPIVDGRSDKKYCNHACRNNAYHARHNKDPEYMEKKRKRCRAWHSHTDRTEEYSKRNRRRVRSGFAAYDALVQRCTNPKSNRFSTYGGRGVRNKLTREQFLSIYFGTDVCATCNVVLNDEDRRRSDGRTIDRIDSAGHYGVDNVRIVCRSCNSKMSNEERKQAS